MSYFRFTIRQLLLATVLVAFACAAVLHPSRTLLSIWTVLSLTGFVALIGIAIFGRDFYRRASIGAIIFCGLQVAIFTFEIFSNEQYRAAYWEVLGFRLDGCFELWNVPERRILKMVPGVLNLDSPDVDPSVIIERDSQLLGILRWQWLWATAGIGWLLGGFVARPSQEGKLQSGGRFLWLYVVAISVAWVIGWQLLYYELSSIRLSGASPRQMWSTFIAPLTLWAWQVTTIFAFLGSPSQRAKFSGVSIAAGLWLAMAFFPGWSATLGDFLPQTMCVRAVSPPEPIFVSISRLNNHDGFVTSPAIVQGEVMPSVTISTPSGSSDPISDPPPRLGITAYLVGGVIGGRGSSPLQNTAISLVTCLIAWPIALAGMWLERRVSRATSSTALCVPTFGNVSTLFAMLVLAMISRQAWVVQLSVLAVYIAIVFFAVHARVGPPTARRQYATATLAMLGWLLLSCGPWFGDHVRPYLPTTLASNWIDKQLGCEPGEPGPDMTLSDETERSLRSSGIWGNRLAHAWPKIVASLGLDHRYPLSTPGTILMAFPAAWIGAYLSRRWSHSPSNAEQPTAS